MRIGTHPAIYRTPAPRAAVEAFVAYLAALALEHNCTFMTTDRDFAKFPRLRWQHPLDQKRPTPNPA